MRAFNKNENASSQAAKPEFALAGIIIGVFAGIITSRQYTYASPEKIPR
jgi:hypothetical protein